MTSSTRGCLNCGTELLGRFCSSCGQRDLPPQPTLRELIAEAWAELTVLDTKLLATLGLLLRYPGKLTLEVLAGRRERYIKPMRLYLIASLAFFVIAAIVPPVVLVPTTAQMPGKEKITVNVLDPQPLTPEQREVALAAVERAPKLFQPLFRRLVTDPAGFRHNMMDLLPKVVFVLVPVFSIIVAAFYRRPFSQHLVFTLHLYAAVFAIMGARRLLNFTGSGILVAVAEIIALLYLVVYGLRAFHAVYGGRWPVVVVKAGAIGLLYAIAAGLALTIAAGIAAIQG